MNGIIVIDKPENYTSFDVIARLRKKLGQKKLGHMGTLDPMATGVLPVLLGGTAKFQVFVSDNEKAYRAKMKFGIRTDTLDITGKIVDKRENKVNRKDLENILNEFLGEIEQIPPMFSAIKQNGVKLCDLARKGVEVDRKKRKVTISSIKINSFDFELQEAEITVFCSKGTYIRTLGDDIGIRLGCYATLAELRRILSNGFDVSASVPLEKVLNCDVEEITKKYILPTEKLFENLSVAEISEAQTIRFKNGGGLALSRVSFRGNIADEMICKVENQGDFIGLGKVNIKSQELCVVKCLN